MILMYVLDYAVNRRRRRRHEPPPTKRRHTPADTPTATEAHAVDSTPAAHFAVYATPIRASADSVRFRHTTLNRHCPATLVARSSGTK